MSKPTIDDTRWSVDGANVDSVNLSNPLSGLKDTGWPDHAVPTAKNLNWLFRKVHRWLAWIDRQIDDVTTHKQGFISSNAGGIAATQATISASGAHTVILQGMRVGDTITAVRVRLHDAAGAPVSKAQFKLYSLKDGVITDGGAPPTPLATSAKSAGNATTQTLSVTGLSVTVDSLTDYAITVTETDGTDPILLFCVETDTQRPTTP